MNSFLDSNITNSVEYLSNDTYCACFVWKDSPQKCFNLCPLHAHKLLLAHQYGKILTDHGFIEILIILQDVPHLLSLRTHLLLQYVQ